MRTGADGGAFGQAVAWAGGRAVLDPRDLTGTPGRSTAAESG
ncbi:hypothetical protein [Nonomuraea sp. NPDC050786]